MWWEIPAHPRLSSLAEPAQISSNPPRSEAAEAGPNFCRGCPKLAASRSKSVETNRGRPEARRALPVFRRTRSRVGGHRPTPIQDWAQPQRALSADPAVPWEEHRPRCRELQQLRRRVQAERVGARPGARPPGDARREHRAGRPVLRARRRGVRGGRGVAAVAGAVLGARSARPIFAFTHCYSIVCHDMVCNIRSLSTEICYDMLSSDVVQCDMQDCSHLVCDTKPNCSTPTYRISLL